ncbi:MAG: Crp/Fnr family transcriptional regulator [Bacteroidales bacterium]
MNNNNALFFCNICQQKTDEDNTSIKAVCSIEHTLKTFKKGEHIAYQGNPVSHLFILSKGKIKTEMVLDSGLAIPIEDISAPYPLATAFIFADNNRFPVDVIALSNCELMVISKDAVERQMAKCPNFWRGFMAFNANQIQFLSERIKVLSQKGIKAKLAYYISQRAKQGNFDLERSITSLAEYFGVERPSLSRELSAMVREGVILLDNGVGKILDFKKIKKLME